MKKKHLLFALALALTLGADQLSKQWARARLAPDRAGITIVEGYFDLRYSENDGAAFGFLRGVPGARYLFFPVGIVALVAVARYLRKARPEQRRVAVELGVLAGGVVGNLADRVLFGRVTDFILWHAHSHAWPLFNLADAALVLGVLGLWLDTRDRKSTPPAPVPDRS